VTEPAVTAVDTGLYVIPTGMTLRAADTERYRHG
jgi:hypothetical protein